MTGHHILVVDDEPDIRDMLKDILEEEKHEVSVAENAAMARQALQERRPDLILLDVWMPDVDGITLLGEWADEGKLPCPVIIMSGHGTIETAVEATRLGAYDFIEKPISLAKLLLTIEHALEADKLARENNGLRRHLPSLDEPIGRSAAMQELREQAKRLARHDTRVLITGESGVGKETFARFLHLNSARADGPFIEIGGASIATENSSVELFGSENEGRIHYGMFEQANAGTLFINEVADMDLQTQARLQSALESKRFMRVGGNTPVKVDVRVVAATHLDLAKAVKQGRFREDLYYNLNVVPLAIPPLREHSEDIPDLLQYYTDYCVAQDGLPYRHFSTAAQNRLRNYGWPGNIRELKNLVQRLLILGSGEVIEVGEVEQALGVQTTPNMIGGLSASVFEMPLREAREQFEKAYLEHQLRASGGSVSKLARLVGMERTNLYRKLRGLGIDPREYSDG